MDPSVLDPQTFDLSIILTAAGVPVAAGILASLIQVLKRVPFFGSWLAAGDNARFANVIASAALIGYAFTAVGVELTPGTGFMAVLAWLNLVGFTDKAYEIAPTAVKTALGGSGT